MPAVRQRPVALPICGSDDWSYVIGLLKNPWFQRLNSLGICGVDRLADDMFLRIIFSHLPSAKVPAKWHCTTGCLL